MTHHRLGIVAALALVGLFAVTSVLADASSRSGRIEGQVVFDDGGPVRRALVTLSGQPIGPGLVTLTDADGRFGFSGLPPGRFTLSATKAPHLPAYFGSLRVGHGPGQPIALAAGDAVTDLALTMTRGAVISGRVLDAQGRPQAHALVSILVAAGSGGPIAPHVTVSTNDLGEYRAYALPAGRYLVAAQSGFGFNGASVVSDVDLRWAEAEIASRHRSESPGRMTPPAPARRTMTYAPTLHPNATNPAAATMVEVSAGDERGAIDIRLQMVPSTRLRGRVIGPDGRTPENLSVGVIWPGQTLGLTEKNYIGSTPSNLGMSVRDGAFTRSALTPGRYVFVARGSSNQPDGKGEQAPLDLWAVEPVDINGELDRSLEIMLRPGMLVSGRVTSTDTGGRTGMPGLELSPIADDLHLGVSPATIGVEGEFSFVGVPPGTYVLNLANAAEAGIMIQSVSWEGRHVADARLTIRDGLDVRDVSVVLGDRRTAVSGRLVDGLGRPAPEYVIVVFPTDRTMWHPSLRRVRGAQPATDGRYRVAGLPPGTYLVAAVTSLNPADLRDPDFLRMLAEGASSVTIGLETVTLDLQIVGG